VLVLADSPSGVRVMRGWIVGLAGLVLASLATAAPAVAADDNPTESLSEYHRTERHEDTLALMEAMHADSMVVSGDEIVCLAWYRAWFERPMAAAALLGQGLDSGPVVASPESLGELMAYLQQAGEWQEASSVARELTERFPVGPSYQLLGDALVLEGDVANALAAYSLALELAGLIRPGDVWVRLGVQSWELDQRETAIDSFKQALKWPYSRRYAEDLLMFANGKLTDWPREPIPTIAPTTKFDCVSAFE
jgi:tetratricopeptide (TPR) repeat protein